MEQQLELIWSGMCICLVFFMQAGFALLESGSARAKNAINVMMKNYMDMCIGGIIFWGVGYGLMYGDSAGWFGSSHFFLNPPSSKEAMDLAYQTMFAATAATIVSGAVAERMKFSSYLIFSGVITGLIYPIFGGWIWNANGWLAKLGVVDFAGCLVVHSVGAWCALAALIVLGPRLGRFSLTGEAREIPGHNLTLVALGAFILWIGWFGFNGGSIDSLSKDNLGLVILNTHLGGCAGALGAMAFMATQKKPTLMTATINGSIAGLVSITAGAVHFSPTVAIMVGFLGGIFYSLGAQALVRFKIDDVVDAIAVHGVGGTWGALAVALFPQHDFSWHSLFVQGVGIVMAFLWTFPLAYILFKALAAYLGVRASTLHEQRGLDYTEHYELGYPEFQKNLITVPTQDKAYE